MSKFVFIYCGLVFCLFLQAAQPEKAVTPRTFSPKSRTDASKDFYKAMDEFSRNKFERAYNTFSKAVMADNITPEEKNIALYNSALSLERDKKYSKALDVYNAIKNNDPDRYYRISACCHELKKWDCVMSGLKNWKNASGSLSLVEEFEFRVRTGSAYLSLSSYKDSIEYLETAVRAFTEKKHLLLADAQNKEYTENKINALGLWSLDDLASAYKIIGKEVKLPINDEDSENTPYITSLKNQVNLKAYYYLKSQDTYLQMLQLGDATTASKGLFMIGELYQDAYKSFMNSGAPNKIKDQKLEKEYSEELKASLRPLLEKAKIAYNKNIELAHDYKTNNEWIKKSRAALSKIKD
jgi:hypothetical protein